MFWLLNYVKRGGSLKGAIREFTKMNGRMPSSAEMNKMEAIIKDAKSNVIQFPKQKSSLAGPKQTSSLAGLLKTGAVKRGIAPKTTPKDPIDQRWASQEEWAAKRRAENKAALQRFEDKFGKPEDRAKGGLAGQLHLNQGGRVPAFKGGLMKMLQALSAKSPLQRYKDYLASVKKRAQAGDMKSLAPELGAVAGSGILVNRAMSRKLKDITNQERDAWYKKLEAEYREEYKDDPDMLRLKLEMLEEDRENFQNRKWWQRGPAYNDGGRVRFDNGGMSRRKFLQLMGGLAALPVVGKFFKLAKPAAKAVKAVEASNAAGMPAWFPKLVDKVMKEGKDVSKQYATTERVVVKEVELPGSKTKVIVDQDLTTGDTVVDIGYGKHGFESGRYGQPVRLHLQKGEWIEPKKGQKKGVKTKDEFDVEEAEFTGDAENIKYEESSIEKYGDHGSDFSEVEKYATGKNVDKKVVGKKREADEWAQGQAEADAERWADEADDFAKGGLAGVLKL